MTTEPGTSLVTYDSAALIQRLDSLVSLLTPDQKIDLKVYLDSMLAEREKALEAVAQERDRAAEVLRGTTETAAVAVRAAADRVAKDNYDRVIEAVGALRRESAGEVAALRRENTIEFAARDSALLELKSTTADRDAKNNEFRQQLGDQAATFLTRTEYNAAHEALEKLVTNLRTDYTDLRQVVAVGSPGVATLTHDAAVLSGARDNEREGGVVKRSISSVNGMWIMIGVSSFIALVSLMSLLAFVIVHSGGG